MVFSNHSTATKINALHQIAKAFSKNGKLYIDGRKPLKEIDLNN